MGKILIVEDDVAISDLLQLNLNMVGYKVRQAYDGEKALKIIEEESIDLVILDIMLPKIDGFEIMEKIQHLKIPVICLTAKNSISDKVKGLKIADDYIVKPFEAIELLARMEAVLRRYGKENNSIHLKNLEILLKERMVKKEEEIIELTPKEFELLIFLVKNKGIALSREQIIEAIWGYDYFGESRTIDMHIQKLRKKLELEKEIKTVYKVGYRLEA